MWIARALLRSVSICLSLALVVVATGACGRGESAPETISEEEFQVALAKHLKSVGSTLYEMEGCGWCEKQREWFGEGARYINEVYCLGAEHLNPQPYLCQAKGIEGTPTWEINNQLYKGARPLAELARISGYAGPLPENISIY